jgi:hypothetical protein
MASRVEELLGGKQKVADAASGEQTGGGVAALPGSDVQEAAAAGAKSRNPVGNIAAAVNLSWNAIEALISRVKRRQSDCEATKIQLEAQESEMMVQQAERDEESLSVAADVDRAVRDADYSLNDALNVEREARSEVQEAEGLLAEITALLEEKKRILLAATSETELRQKELNDKQVEAMVAKADIVKQKLVAEREGARLRAALALHQEKFLDARIELEETKAIIFRGGIPFDKEKVKHLLGVGTNGE